MLYFKGYQAVQVHRIAHELWLGERDGGEKNGKNTRGEKDIGRGAAQEKKSGVRASRVMARMLQSRVSEVFAVVIHPAATRGRCPRRASKKKKKKKAQPCPSRCPQVLLASPWVDAAAAAAHAAVTAQEARLHRRPPGPPPAPAQRASLCRC